MKGWDTPPPNRSEPMIDKSFYFRGELLLSIEYWNSSNFFFSFYPWSFEFTFNHWPQNKLKRDAHKSTKENL